MAKKAAKKTQRGRPFQKGHTGNPGGKPTGAVSIKAAMRRMVKEAAPGDPSGRAWAELIALRILTKAEEGDVQFARLAVQYVDGMPDEPETVALGEQAIEVIKQMRALDDQAKGRRARVEDG